MDGLQLIRKQSAQDTSITKNTDELANARQSAATAYRSLKDRLDAMDQATEKLETNINGVVSGLDWKASVDTFANIATTYPNPKDGWTVNVKDTDITYRYTGNQWIAISSNSIPVVNANANGLMSSADKNKLDNLNSANYVLKTGDTMTGRLIANGGITGSLTGNADTSTKLQNPRNINGVAFDGSKDINITMNGTSVKLTGYAKPGTGGAVSATDTLNAAIGKLEFKVDNKVSSVRLNALRNRVQVNSTTATVNIGITNYNANNDVLNVYLSGVRLEPTVEYTSTQTAITLTNQQTFINGDIVTFEVIQAVGTKIIK